MERSLVDYSPWDHKESDTTERLHFLSLSCGSKGSPGGSVVKNPPTMQETQVRSLDGEDPLKEKMAIHSSILPWRIPWTEQSMGLQRAGHD